MVKNPPANTGELRDTGLIPGLGRSPGGRHGNPLQHSCLENPMDRGAWRAAVQRVAKSRTRLKRLSGCRRARTHTHTHTHTPCDQGPRLFCLPFCPLCLGQCLHIIKTQEEFTELMYLVNFVDEGNGSLKGLNNFTMMPLPGGRRTSMRVRVLGWLVPLRLLSQSACCLSGNTVSPPLMKLKLSQHCMQMSSSSVSISMRI